MASYHINFKQDIFFIFLILGAFLVILFLSILRYYYIKYRQPRPIYVINMEEGHNGLGIEEEPLPPYASNPDNSKIQTSNTFRDNSFLESQQPPIPSRTGAISPNSGIQFS